MKRVSFEVAKAIKEAGYPQDATLYMYVTKDYSTFEEGELIDAFFSVSAGDNVVDAPYVMEVWLWLWREKGIHILKDTTESGCVEIVYKHCLPMYIRFHDGKSISNDPEEAIIAAIEYLVDNDLIK